MAVNTITSTQAKTNINSAISATSFTNASEDYKIQEISLTEIQDAIDKLNTYVTKVNNCGNCINFTFASTICQAATKTVTNTTGTKTVTKSVRNCYYNNCGKACGAD